MGYTQLSTLLFQNWRSFPANAAAHALTAFAGNGPSAVLDSGTTVILLGAALGPLGVARRFLKS